MFNELYTVVSADNGILLRDVYFGEEEKSEQMKVYLIHKRLIGKGGKFKVDRRSQTITIIKQNENKKGEK